MIYKYWYYIQPDVTFKRDGSFDFCNIKTDLIDLGTIKLTKKFLLTKLAYEANLLGRVFLRYEPSGPVKDKWLNERIPSGPQSVY